MSTAGGLRGQMHTSLINELAAAGGSAWGALEELRLYSLHDLTR